MIQKTLKKAFTCPQVFRNDFIKAELIKKEPQQFSGKSFICVSLTRFCSVGCDFCFFKSGNPFKEPTKEDRFFLEGQQRFIQFANEVNLGYLLVSGGGEPMMERSAVLKIITEVVSDRIVLVTSGNWAKDKGMADLYLARIIEALSRRTTKTQLTIRLSFDEGHCKTLKFEPAKNLISLFEEKYKNVPGLTFQIHTFEKDSSLSKLLDELKEQYAIQIHQILDKRIDDGLSASKLVPNQKIISFNGYEIKVGYAKLFYSNLMVDLNNTRDLKKNLEVFQKDLLESEEGNPSVVSNQKGSKGLDFWINYNGNVTSWGNQYLDNLMNIYSDSAKTVIEKTFLDPAAYAFLEKGAEYRDRIVNEVNSTAVLRGKAVNIRDYTSALMFDESRTRLYYTIRVLQDYLIENRLSKSKLHVLPKECLDILTAPIDALKKAYLNAEYTVVEQTIEKPFIKEKVQDILVWIKLNHYQISEKKFLHLLNFYNSHVDPKHRLENFQAIPLEQDGLQVVRMTEYLTHIKEEVLNITDDIF